MSAASDELRVEVWRGAETGAFQAFDVPRRLNQTVLDVVTEIQRDQDPTLSYRFACRVGMCGSCAMVVNGRPRWTCRTRVSEAASRRRRAAARAAAQLHRGQGPRGRDDAASSTNGATRTAISSRARRPADGFRGGAAGDARTPGGRRGDRMHRLRHLLFGLRRGRVGQATTWGLPRSTAPGRWSTTCATPGSEARLAAVVGRFRLPVPATRT